MKRKYLILVFWLIFHSTAFAGTFETKELAKTLAAEAGGEGYTGMYLVANTIMNRAVLYGKTPFQVISQKNQYYGYTAKYRNIRYLEVKKEADMIAANITKLQNKTNGALYFRQLKEPRFKWCKIETVRYKHHIFYK
jgi:spore germination cell wall hydrolase CwlJ-like protein